MDEIKIVVVEDDAGQRKIFEDSVQVYEDKNKRKVRYEFVANVGDALARIDGSYDGAIIDLKLEGEDDGGNLVVRKMMESLFRVPVIFVTGYPDLVDRPPIVIDVYPRGAGTYEQVLDSFFGIYQSGLTRIMGGRGKIEQTLNKVFLVNLLAQLSTWVGYGQEDSPKTEKALLRFTLNHLLQLLDDDGDQCFPEEVYLFPPLQDGFKTGSIVKEKATEKYCVILSPACDLVVRKSGQINTDRILMVEIDEESKVYDHVFKKLTTHEEKKDVLSKMFGNRHTLYHHWLPKTGFFAGGFINFRKLSSLTKKEYKKQFEVPKIQISPHFVKDILSRFSSYYARQGQPDIDFFRIVDGITALPDQP